MQIHARPLTDEERATYEWQMWVGDFGETGQERLKGASVLISRCGGLGSAAAYELAAAGVGRLVVAHGGHIKASDLNRQLLMTHDALGTPRIDCVQRRLRQLNPRLEVMAVGENVNETNVAALVGEADVVVDCAPLFEERYLLNREAVAQGKPMVECAMYELEWQITTILPRQTACLACLYPEQNPAWRREFPVFGAVSGAVGCLGAMEVIKLVSGIGRPLAGQLLIGSTRDMEFRKFKTRRDPECVVCGSGEASG